MYVQIVGIIQLCEQVAHETPPKQDVPDFLNPKCAPQWARSEMTNYLPLRLGKAKSKEARSKVNGTEISEAKKTQNVLYGRPGFFEELRLQQKTHNSFSHRSLTLPPWGLTSAPCLCLNLHIEACAPLGCVVVAPDPDQHVPAGLHVGGHGDVHPVALVDEALCGADDAGVGRVREGVV